MKFCGAMLAVAVLVGTVQAADKTLEIKLGAAVPRSWDDVKKADYAYGPKQEYDAAKKETHIWLPYGSKGQFFETAGVKLTEPGPDPGTGCPLVLSVDGNTSGNLVYKFHFDQPIGALRFAAGWSEWGVGGDTVGGVEYSADGQKWTTIREVNEGKIIEPLSDGAKSFQVGKTQDLYIRLYSRDKNNPDAGFGPGRWMKFRMGGDPAWGDASTTFFNCQLQLWVTPAEGGAAVPAQPAAGGAAAPDVAAAIEEARAAAQEAKAAAEEARKAAQEARAVAQGAKPAQPSTEAAAPAAPTPQPAGNATPGTLEVKLGTAIARSWDDVKKAGYAYGPKQDFDAARGETHVYLPYGKDTKWYDEVRGELYNPEPGSLAKFHSPSGEHNGVLTYKLHFDRPIGALRYWAGWTELGLAPNTAAGVEYSEDGKTWKTIREIKGSEKSGIVEPFVNDVKAAGLNTDTLYIRHYSRDPKNWEGSGPGRWLQMRMSGDPSWGDAATSFFASQLQLWVTPAKGGAAARVEPAAEKPVETAAPQPVAGQPGAADPRDDASPWGMGSGAEWSGDYPKFNPMLQKAGVKWLRLFTEWQVIQPRQGQWNWKVPDAMVANARANNIHLTGIWCYFAPWTSADGGTRKGPIKNMQYWRDYVAATVARYQKDIKYWEIWNEFNGSFYEGQNKVKDYADLVVAAYDTAKKIDPNIKIGMSVANFDVSFLDAAIKAGAAGHFDYICVHPYENLGAVAEGGEVGYLSLVNNLRQMLAANKQRTDIPLWITEIGYQTPTKAEPKGDGQQADMLTKAYLLSVAQGFDRIFWFEARGPAYGQGTDHGIIRPDWSPRPAYEALKTMTSLLGPEPRYLGWLDLGHGGYGFLFQGRAGKVLAAWSPAGKQHQAKFSAAVGVTTLAGRQSSLAAGQELVLTKTPVFITGLPADLAQQAKANLGKPYPWGGDYAHAKVVTCRLGATNIEDGLKQTSPGTTVVVNGLTDTCRRTDFVNPALHNEGHYVYFRVDPLFVPYGTKDLAITIVAKRVAAAKSAGMNLSYESTKGYRGAEGWWTIPEGDEWYEHTWKVSDASFVGQWGWNFRFDAISSPNEFLIKEVRVTK